MRFFAAGAVRIDPERDQRRRPVLVGASGSLVDDRTS
jgi:hypothetical protein